MEFADLFKGQSLNMECPGCKESFDAPAEQVVKESAVVTCPHCNSNITIQHTNDSVKDAEKALSDLQKAFDNFGK